MYIINFLLATLQLLAAYVYATDDITIDGGSSSSSNYLRASSSQQQSADDEISASNDQLLELPEMLFEYEYTKSLRDNYVTQHQVSTRTFSPTTSYTYLTSPHSSSSSHDRQLFLEICLPPNTPCSSSSTSNCCQGGCSSSTNTCYCQPTGDLCFNAGGNDLFCCSNQCGDDGLCIDGPITETVALMSSTSNSCSGEKQVCFNDGQCCSNICGSNGRCEASSVGAAAAGTTTTTSSSSTGSSSSSGSSSFCRPNKQVCFGNGQCCSKTCGTNGRCEAAASSSTATASGTSTSTAAATPKPTRNPTPNPITPKPTPNPVPKPTPQPVYPVVPVKSNCQAANHVCWNHDQCCSKQCDLLITGRCIGDGSGSGTSGGSSTTTTKTPPPPTPKPTSKQPTLKPLTPQPSPKPSTIPPHIFATKTVTSGGCPNDPTKTKITIEIKTDQWGADVGWSLVDITSNNDELIYDLPNGTYGLYHHETVELCVDSPGLYNFSITDRFGDGICCAYGEGYIKISIANREVMHVKSYGKGFNDLIRVGYDPTPEMSDRDHLYHYAHNKRRTQWYTENNVPDVQLVWSPVLAEESRLWAEKLLVNCSIPGIEHEPGVEEGENLAKNTGTVNNDGGGWGQLYPPDNIVNRWVEFEVERDYPGNAHLTQALWRAAKYMGCGESVQDFRNGKCRVQVCRYARAGNCDMGRYDASIGRNWLPPMLHDTSPCGPNCPKGGCH